MSEPRPLHLVVIEATGQIIRQLDLAGVENANASCLLVFEIQIQCDLGHRHVLQHGILEPWELP